MDIITPPFRLSFTTYEIDFPEQRFQHPGHYWIQGPSGSGKTSYFRYLLNLFPESMVSKPPVLPREAFAWTPQRLTLGIGKTMAHFKALVLQSEKRERILRRLSLWDWPEELMDREFGELSGGEKARLSLAIALESARPWLLMDESLSEIDPKRSQLVMQELTQTSMGILAISHSPLPFEKRNLFHVGA